MVVKPMFHNLPAGWCALWGDEVDEKLAVFGRTHHAGACACNISREFDHFESNARDVIYNR